MTTFSNYEISVIDKSWKSFNKSLKLEKTTIKEIRIAVYLRKSTEDIKDNSLKLQLSEIRNFVESINLTYYGKYKFYFHQEDIFAEDNVSGMQGRLRPEFNRMLNFIEQNPGYYGVCLVYKLDRFSRKLEDTLNYITLLKTFKCVLKALDFEDNGDPTSDLLRNILGVVAQYHAQNSALTSIKGTIKKVEEHKAVGLLPYGLISEKNKLCNFTKNGASNILIDDEKAIVVKLIFELYVKGYSISDIKTYLKENGYRKDNGEQFSWQQIYYMLRNKKYNGTYTYGDPNKKHYRKYDNGVKKPDFYEKENAFPKIIEDDLFNQVQLLLNNKFNKHQYGKEFTNYHLTGLIYCSSCNVKMTGWSRRKYKNVQYADYICKIHKNHKDICNTKNINRLYIEEVVINLICQVVNYILYSYNDKLLLTSITKNMKIKTDLETINKELKVKENQVKKLIDRILIDEDFVKYYQDKLKTLKNDIKILQDKFISLQNISVNSISKIQNKIKNFNLTKDLLLLNPNILRTLIIEIIEKIEVSNETIKIHIKNEEQ